MTSSAWWVQQDGKLTLARSHEAPKVSRGTLKFKEHSFKKGTWDWCLSDKDMSTAMKLPGRHPADKDGPAISPQRMDFIKEAGVWPSRGRG